MKIAVAFALAALGMTQAETPPTNCAPRERRMTAIRHARLINTAEAGQRGSGYLSLAALGVPPVSDDYKVQLSTDGTRYSFSIKDMTDACRGVVFSDQDGLIYVGAPLQ